MKTNPTRRTLLKGGTALVTSGALVGSALLEWTKAWAQTAPWIPERGAHLSLPRWKYFVQAEDEAFVTPWTILPKPPASRLTLSESSTLNSRVLL
jgi:hypothetical protein